MSCNEAAFRQYIYYYLDLCSDPKLESVSDVTLLGVGSNYLWLGAWLGRKIPKVVMRNDVGGASLRGTLQTQPNWNLDGDGRSCIGSFKD